MQRLQAYKYELMPNGEQQRAMRRFAGSCRFVYNKALALQKESHAAGNKFIGYVPMAKHLTNWRNSLDTPWLKDAPCQAHPFPTLQAPWQRGYRLLACGEPAQSGRSMKQEPAEATAQIIA